MALEQEHQRGAGGWAAEWQTLRELFVLSAGSLERLRDIVQGSRSIRRACARISTHALGLPLAESLTFALAAKIGSAKRAALVDAAVKRAVAEKRPLAEIAVIDARPSPEHSPPAEIDACT